MNYSITLAGILATGTIFFMSVCQFNKSVTLTNYQSINSNLQTKTLEQSITSGEEIYLDFCMQCHLSDGKGVPNTFPPLAGSDWLKNKREESIHAIKYGLQGTIEVNGIVYNSAMTSLGLEDEEIADVMNYIMNNWGNSQKTMVTPQEVNKIAK
ncbi:c-type cytochrome [Aquimarina sp. W85]|uniref:c-type cytochrome n=1 Tax=Aquimarina rhodophyticola TaxID=3342246 RepID=UPI0036715F73